MFNYSSEMRFNNVRNQNTAKTLRVMTEPYTIVFSHFHENDNIRSIILDKNKKHT